MRLLGRIRQKRIPSARSAGRAQQLFLGRDSRNWTTWSTTARCEPGRSILVLNLAITSGCDATNYCPDSNVRRGQMAVFIVRALVGNNFRFSTVPYFDDTAANHPFFRFIQKMKEGGITAGCTASSYCPDNNTTRGQMGVFIIHGFDTAR
jgi:hypothetical protein